jgi:hypothetical protein
VTIEEAAQIVKENTSNTKEILVIYRPRKEKKERSAC